MRRLREFVVLMLLASGAGLPAARACPFCRADAAGLAAPSEAPQDSLGLQYSGGIDFPTAFYFRGYNQATHGPILQPYLNIFSKHAFSEDIVVRPYVSLFHSTQPDDQNRMADMSDVMVGGVASSAAFSVDARYAFFTMNQLMRSNVHEFGIKASYDVLSLLKTCDCCQSPFALRPFFGAYFDLFDELGTEDVFLNVGIEPSWRGEVAGLKVGLSLPTDWGLSADDYYLNADGSNAALGYFSTSLAASVLLPCSGRTQWFVNASVQYLHLAADSVRAVSPWDNLCIGKLGVSFVY